jgi:hypothetical protein
MASWIVQGAIFVSRASKRQVAGSEGPGVCSRKRQTRPVRMHRTSQKKAMGSPRTLALVYCAFLASSVVTPGYSHSARRSSARQEQARTTKQAPSKGEQVGAPALPRGKKLVLKDGNFQLVRDYRRNGERVRYLSAERGEWEEIPAEMVDWDATAKAAAEEQSEEDALARKIHAQEQAQRIETVMDIDASLQVAPGVFLPPGEGMFLVDGKSVKPLEQVGSQIKTDKKQYLKRALSPIPIIPSKRNVQIPGTKASIRVTSGQAEFYLREAPPDQERTTPIVKSSRPGESGPEVELVQATVKGNNRQLESIKSLFGQQVEERHNTISIQRWEIAPTVFRFTVSEALPPGEYALAEILPDGMNLFVWDFGVDPATGAKPAAAPKKKN